MAVWILWFIHSDIKPSSHRWFSQSRSAIAACIVSINVASRVSLPALHRKILRFQKISIKSKQLQFWQQQNFVFLLSRSSLLKAVQSAEGKKRPHSLSFILQRNATLNVACPQCCWPPFCCAIVVFPLVFVLLIVIVIAGWLLLGIPAAGVGLSHDAYEWRAFIFGYCFSRVKRPKRPKKKKESVLGMFYWAYFASWFTCCANLHSSQSPDCTAAFHSWWWRWW